MSARVPDDERRARWRRRLVTIPAVLGLTLGAVIAAPVAAPVAALTDLVRGRSRLPTVRTYGVLVQYLVNDSVEILVAPVLWLAADCGRQLGSPTSIRRHERVQRWSTATLARRAEQLLGLRVELDDAAALEPGPAIVLCRHVNLADASLPALLYQVQRGYHIRGVLMAELLADPGFDLFYSRTGSVFVDRASGETARRMTGHVGRDLTADAVAVIFPEGRLFREDVRDRRLARLAVTSPDRAARLTSLRHLLPPHPGGVLALLDAAPHADVVVIGHTGFESVASFAELRRRVPLDRPIRVTAWRVPRADVPTTDEDRIRWLDGLWLDLDERLDVALVADESGRGPRG